MTRVALYAVALLTGAYAAVMWSIADLHQSGISGAISAAALIAVEGIRYCTRRPTRNRGRTPIYPQWTATGPGRFDLELGGFDDQPQPPRRPVWPNEVGAPE